MLKKIGFSVYPSQANFVMVRRRGDDLSGLYQELKRRGILVRYFGVRGLEDALRITVGTPQEIKTLLFEMAAVLEVT